MTDVLSSLSAAQMKRLAGNGMHRFVVGSLMVFTIAHVAPREVPHPKYIAPPDSGSECSQPEQEDAQSSQSGVVEPMHSSESQTVDTKSADGGVRFLKRPAALME